MVVAEKKNKIDKMGCCFSTGRVTIPTEKTMGDEGREVRARHWLEPQYDGRDPEATYAEFLERFDDEEADRCRERDAKESAQWKTYANGQRRYIDRTQPRIGVRQLYRSEDSKLKTF
ncbi:hypothetical protein MCOR27_004625 [Pyricularia oryzae]|nr:hypothetical protein MCOR02_010667 [Pyricularia oryzae]KAI6280538.1 hypothetical protein MCOR27_004625 [Pyricularia oryzae]KAI6323011.1 hypothetical protein MCOR34_002092 [Pyricularia oryzae]KAI6505431.1 hypothetical protein MCOR13_004229 [Pyricularia oryzae]KAI6605646.1 hypothetical protein MCOR04_001150 [Pyricularia oryzae]